jgi:subtilisin family serine protease
MKYVYFGSDRRFGTGVAEYDTASSTSYGHANAAGAIGVGAAAWFNTAAFNDNPECDPACLNGFSSAGGVPILFDTEGNRVFELRAKPEIVGPDGANNTFFGFDLSFPVPGTDEPDGFPNFFGTSASAPHLAGVAALMSQPTVNGKQFYVCKTTPSKEKTLRVGAKAARVHVAKGATYGACAADIRDALTSTAIDMDDPFTPEFDEGFDFATGHGFVDALEALERVYFRETGKKR